MAGDEERSDRNRDGNIAENRLEKIELVPETLLACVERCWFEKWDEGGRTDVVADGRRSTELLLDLLSSSGVLVGKAKVDFKSGIGLTCAG